MFVSNSYSPISTRHKAADTALPHHLHAKRRRTTIRHLSDDAHISAKSNSIAGKPIQVEQRTGL